MKFTTLQPGEDLSRLTRRLFQTRSRTVRQAAQEALLRANPHLADPKSAPPDALIIVPEVPGAEPSAAAVGSERDVVTSLLRQARQQLGDLRPSLDARIQGQEEETKAALARADTPELRKLAQKEPELKRRLAAIAQNRQTELKRIQAFRAVQQEAITQLEQDLDNFMKATVQPHDAK